ncbi:MAG: hypothetical protein ACO27L_01515 [Schleiferiaceae bacterium]
MANERTVDEAPARLLSADEVAKYYQGETVIWTETFANGIPTSWMNYGTANGTANHDHAVERHGFTRSLCRSCFNGPASYSEPNRSQRFCRV